MDTFIEAIRDNCAYFRKVMPNVWLVDTVLTPAQLSRELRKHITPSDSLLVMRTAPEYAGWLSEEAWKWLRVSASNGDFE